MTLEQKLAWADARGIEPPAHVRPAVEARATKAKPKKAKRPCCQEAHAAPTEPACREQAHEATTTHESDSTPELRWVSGFFTQKCRGEGPAGLLKLEPTTSTVLELTTKRPEPAAWLAPLASEDHVSITSPPQPPPPKA